MGSARVATIGTLVAALTVVGYAFAPSVWWLGGLAFVVGSRDTIIDVAQNAHGLRVQAEYRRSILNSFHAIWSLGAVLGGLLGGAAAAIRMPLAWQFSATGLLVAVIAIAALVMALPGPDPEKTHEDGHAPAGLRRVPLRVWGVLTALTFVAIGGAWVEDAAMTWAASYLSDELSTGAGLAAAGLIAMMSMHFLGRIIGDRLVDRFGEPQFVSGTDRGFTKPDRKLRATGVRVDTDPKPADPFDPPRETDLPVLLERLFLGGSEQAVIDVS